MAGASAAISPTLRERYEAAGQSQVFRFVDAGVATEEEAKALSAQLESIDLEYVAKSLKSAQAEAAALAEAVDLEPPDQFTCLADATAEDIASWRAQGLDAIGRGEVAACVLAGGQGTRLGFDGPKGCYDIGLPSKKPLFQLFVEKLLRLRTMAKEAGGPNPRLPFLIMTSPMTHMQTVSFFEENNYFGTSKEEVWFFEQGTMPCLSPDGKIILESAGTVASNPDGNGGLYPALQRSGCLGRLQSLGVKSLHVFSVDNPLCRPADPCFVGYCLARSADCGNKCVWKASPEEKVGVVAKKGGRPSVVEYSELDDARKNQLDGTGRLAFGAGNICNHFFSIDFLANVVVPNMAAMFHLAHKKIPCAGEDGKTVKPDSNNGLKLEAFVFDVFPMSSKMAILETKRQEEFAPVKNAPGTPSDSPDSARAMVSALCRSWIEQAGGKLEGSKDEVVEVSPLLSYAGEGLAERVSGQTFPVPCHLE
ncbi:UDP-N-acetylhexosamine pyrophosphorylase [Symbiodinium microadriaticum]|uniref:UDP-N-acetylglucosamine diphosphorylase n=1 Tax=Symbiodinium microadriaticum TaxID=2951 RepID=A0A1Q9ENI8_SYMMI|nr:UDP-N-acetylhexosamine pyrophosphorylase [Symbiodinium microadriaticum]